MSDDQSTFYIQVSPARGPVNPQSNSEEFLEATEDKLKEVAELIRKGCANAAEGIFEIANPPAEVGMEFGIDVGGEAGIPFVTKGTINANFKVSVVWRKA